MTQKVICTQKIHDSNTIYIFRKNGIEVEVRIVNRNLIADTPLFKYEQKYIKQHFL